MRLHPCHAEYTDFSRARLGETATYLCGRMHLAARLQQIPLSRLAGIQRLQHARVRFFKKSLEAWGRKSGGRGRRAMFSGVK